MAYEELCEKIIGKEKIYDGHVVHLEKWSVILPDGKPAQREVIHHVGAAAIVAMDEKGRVAMVRQYRTALGRVTYEIPAGKLDHFGADRLEAAKRELKEETGLSAEKWVHMTDICTTPGFCDEVIGLYLATGLSRGDTNFDDDEFLNVEMAPFDELIRQARSGKIEDCKTLCALLMAETYRKGAEN